MYLSFYLWQILLGIEWNCSWFLACSIHLWQYIPSLQGILFFTFIKSVYTFRSLSQAELKWFSNQAVLIAVTVTMLKDLNQQLKRYSEPETLSQGSTIRHDSRNVNLSRKASDASTLLKYRPWWIWAIAYFEIAKSAIYLFLVELHTVLSWPSK